MSAWPTLPADAPEPTAGAIVRDRVGDIWVRVPDAADPMPWHCAGGAPDSADSVPGQVASWSELQKDAPLTIAPRPDHMPPPMPC